MMAKVSESINFGKSVAVIRGNWGAELNVGCS